MPIYVVWNEMTLDLPWKLVLFLYGVAECQAGKGNYGSAYTYRSIYDSGLSADELSGIVVGSLLAFGVVLVVLICVCRYCGFCGYPRDTRRGIPAHLNTGPLHIRVAVIDMGTNGIHLHGDVQKPYQPLGLSSRLPGLPPYPGELSTVYHQDGILPASPPPYTALPEENV